MIDYLFEPYNAPFLYALYFMLGILGLEILSLIAGLGLSEIVDNLFDATDVGLDNEIDADVEIEGNFITKYIAWIKVKNVPMLILVIVFLASFSITGFVGQSALVRFFDFVLPTWASILGFGLAAVPGYYWVSKFLGEKLFKEETSAVSEKTFLGQTAEINMGTAKLGLPAEAKLKDQYGQLHYFLVEPETDGEEFEQGTKVQLIRKENNSFKAIKLKQ